jgi:Putative prokaryotic signal transducing protein
MSEPGRAPDVRIAEFVYRHEAEFAAGFLDDAGIPYLLQADSDLGVTVSQPARIWVRAEDAEAARDALTVLEGGDGTVAVAEDRSVRVGPTRTGSRLCGAERAVSATLAAILVSFGLGPLGGLGAVGTTAVWVALCLALGIIFAVSALAGRTLPPVKAALAALSGVG